MTVALDSKQVVSFEELLTSQTASQDALIRLLIQKGIFTQEEVLDMIREVERARKRKGN